MSDAQLREWGVKPALTSEDLQFIADVRELRDVQEKYNVFKDKLDRIATKVCSHIPEEIGEQIKEVGDVRVIVTRGERFDWDQDLMAQLLNDMDALPDHVKKRYTVEKRRYEKLPPEDQQLLMPALTRKAGPAKIVVEDKHTNV